MKSVIRFSSGVLEWANAPIGALLPAEFDGRTLTRGGELYADRCVVEGDASCDKRQLQGQGIVLGSKGNRYSVAVRITRPGSGAQRQAARRAVATDCTCPIGAECKHGVALLLAIHRAATQRIQSAIDEIDNAGFADSDHNTRRSNARTHRLPAPPASELATLAAKAHPTLRLFIGRLMHTYASMSSDGYLPGPQAHQWQLRLSQVEPGGLRLAATAPATEAEFCAIFAFWLRHSRQTWPAELNKLLDPDAVPRSFVAYWRDREVALWTDRLNRPSAAHGYEPAAATLGKLFVAIDLAKHEARLLHFQGKKLARLKPHEFEALQLDTKRDRTESLLVSAFERHAAYDINGVISLRSAPPHVRTLFAEPATRERFVTPSGKPLPVREPGRWQLAPAPGPPGYSLLRHDIPEITSASALIVSPALALVFSPDGTRLLPIPSDQPLTLTEPLVIPDAALRTEGGLRMLHQLGVQDAADALGLVTARVHTRVEFALTPGHDALHLAAHGYLVTNDGVTLEHWSPDGPRRVATRQHATPTASKASTATTAATASGAAKRNARPGPGTNVRESDSEAEPDNLLDRLAWLWQVQYGRASMPSTAHRRDPVDTAIDRSAAWDPRPLFAELGLAKHAAATQTYMARITAEFPENLYRALHNIPAGTEVVLHGDLAGLREGVIRAATRLHVVATEHPDWFNCSLVVKAADVELTPAEQKALMEAAGAWVALPGRGFRRLMLDDNTHGLLELGMAPNAEPQRAHALQLGRRQLREFTDEDVATRILARVESLVAPTAAAVPAGLTATLRPYQTQGLAFLQYLAQNQFGGVLADDMGLGKTVQALAWLLWLRQPQAPGGAPSAKANAKSSRAAGPAALPPALIVCPKSVVDNWVVEATKFAPSLRVARAAVRQRKAQPFADVDVVVCNYTQLRSFADTALATAWHAVILDEGQYIKNPTSQTAKVAHALQASHRLLLSGTPLENRIDDVWSLLQFAQPGVLPPLKLFRKQYGKGGDLSTRILSAKLRPFLMRRTKAQVAPELPARVEEDLFCELEGKQLDLYQAELKRAQAQLLQIGSTAELQKQRFVVLATLLKLRQICCAPALVGSPKAPSAKLEAALEHIETLMAQGHKVLVFSQFVKMLDLIVAELKTRGIKRFVLTGDTENRGELVQAFQAHDGPAVFCISLKAGGSGLNLTAASYVVLFDPWWNPAVEAQAIDRTHRIGQTQNITAYRLIAKNTVEEKIRALQMHKAKLSDAVIGDEAFANALTLDDLRMVLG